MFYPFCEYLSLPGRRTNQRPTISGSYSITLRTFFLLNSILLRRLTKSLNLKRRHITQVNQPLWVIEEPKNASICCNVFSSRLYEKNIFRKLFSTRFKWSKRILESIRIPIKVGFSLYECYNILQRNSCKRVKCYLVNCMQMLAERKAMILNNRQDHRSINTTINNDPITQVWVI